MKRIAILGSTGSIGQSTLSLIRDRRDLFEPVLLAAHRSAAALGVQAREFQVPRLCLTGLEAGAENPIEGAGSRLYRGPEGIIQALEDSDPDLVLNAVMGSAGLEASAWTLRQGKTLLLANKESLVCAGPLLMALVQKHGGRILPVDSEHAAIHQCLRGERRKDLKRVYLTASGGPFRTWTREQMAQASIQDALAHPTWKMGPRITIGSATLMNKCFEVLEAHHLFGLGPEDIQVLVHPQSIVHSMVEFRDGSLLAQVGVPDMRVPILYCLAWPHRLAFDFEGFDLTKFSNLTFEKADSKRFPTLDMAYEVMQRGGDSGAVLNAADEVAVASFLEGRIPFPKIIETVIQVLEAHEPGPLGSVAQVLEIDAWARREAQTCLDS